MLLFGTQVVIISETAPITDECLGAGRVRTADGSANVTQYIPLKSCIILEDSTVSQKECQVIDPPRMDIL